MQLDNPLWRYALKVYSHPAVAQACLAAQDQGLHVNTLLLCGWLATKGEYFQPESYSSALTLWRDPVLIPLRRLRYQVRAMRKTSLELECCYQHLKQSELAAEQVDIALLWQLHQQQPSSTAAHITADDIFSIALAQTNIARYLKTAEIDSTRVVSCCNQLVEALNLAH